MARQAYVFVVTAIKNTKDTSKIITQAMSGKITKLIIDIPSGWNYTAGIRFQFGDKYLPKELDNSEKYFTGEDTDIDLVPNLELKEDKLEIFAINNDAVNDHSCVITIEVEE